MKNELSIIIGNNIKRLREQKKWSQSDLAKQLGGPPQQISKYERGDNTPGGIKLKKLAEIFQVDVSELTKKHEEQTKVHEPVHEPYAPENDNLPRLTKKEAELMNLLRVLPEEKLDEEIETLKKKVIEHLSGGKNK